ncbi:MAG: hypothetical protein V4488_00220 [Pseudomonadota bacterium]
MKVAFGMKAHSGWAALVVVGAGDEGYRIIDRRRIELVDEAWVKHPYHAAEMLEPDFARRLVERGIARAQRTTGREMRAALHREREHEHEIAACAVLVGKPMPDWSVAEIIAVHIRMHMAEGLLFQDALVHAAQACGAKPVAIPEKLLMQQAEQVFGSPASVLQENLTELRKLVGPPWGKDQKDAALAAMIALQGSLH